MPLDLDKISHEVDKRIADDIESWSVWRYKEDERWRLGASKIGEPCMNQLWLDFRWCTAEDKSGRMYRLLNRGNAEEPKLFEMLRGIGFKVYDIDPNTGKQYKFRSVKCLGHYGGSIDAIAEFPERYEIAEPTLISCKTSGTGSAFNKFAQGVKLANAIYYDQENAYGFGYQIKYATWFVINKNDDDIHIETQKLDLLRGEQLETKAEKIIFSKEPLGKISKSPTFKACGFCKHKDVCHNGVEPAKNCRSCVNAEPVENGEWYCNINQSVIPREFVPSGCNSWVPIING